MPDYTALLDLDPEFAWRHAITSAGWGRVLQREADELLGTDDDASRAEGRRRAHAAASSFTIAAAYAALSDVALAELLFWSASREYLRVGGGRLFGAVLAACTLDRELRMRWTVLAQESQPLPRDWLYALIVTRSLGPADFDAAAIERMREGLTPYRGAHVTELFVPAAVFIDVLVEAFRVERSPAADASGRAAVARLLSAYVDQLEFARAGRPRWSAFNTRFLPVSPEVLATMLAVPHEWWIEAAREPSVMELVAREFARRSPRPPELRPDAPGVVQELHRARYGDAGG